MWDQYCAVPVPLSDVSAVSTVAHYVNGRLSDSHSKALFDLSNSRVLNSRNRAPLFGVRSWTHIKRGKHISIWKTVGCFRGATDPNNLERTHRKLGHTIILAGHVVNDEWWWWWRRCSSIHLEDACFTFTRPSSSYQKHTQHSFSSNLHSGRVKILPNNFSHRTANKSLENHNKTNNFTKTSLSHSRSHHYLPD